MKNISLEIRTCNFEITAGLRLRLIILDYTYSGYYI